jgi:hypothetical protein
MENLPNIIQSIIDQINLNIAISSVDADKLYVCETTLFLTKTKIVVIDGKNYTVIDFELNKWVQVQPKGHTDPVPVDTKIIVAPKITFLHGAPYSTNNEYLQLTQKTLNKTPFIWLLESYEFDDLPRDSSIELAFNARLFFLDWAKEAGNNQYHNEYAIKPMQNLLKEFRKVIDEDFNFKTLEKGTTVVRPRFGAQVKSKGNEPQPKEKIIDEDLSGVDSKIKIEVYDVLSCSCD